MVALAGAAIGLVFVVVNLRGIAATLPPPVEGPPPYVSLYDPPTNAFEVALNQGDGQAFAALATDPSLQRPELFRPGPGEAAYRAQRPLLGWLAWGTSLGRPGAVPAALFGWAIVGYAALGAAAAWLLQRAGAPPRLALLVLLCPGALITLDWTGPEALGVALAMAGVGWWGSERRSLAIVALVLAGLTRETMLLVPMVLLAHELWTTRPHPRLAALAIPPVTYGMWLLVAHARYGAWPGAAGAGRLGMPLAGVADATASWSAPDAVVAATMALLAVLALCLRPRDGVAWIAVAYLASSTVFGSDVWARFEDFSRVLLPMLAFSIVAVASSRAGAGKREPLPVG